MIKRKSNTQEAENKKQPQTTPSFCLLTLRDKSPDATDTGSLVLCTSGSGATGPRDAPAHSAEIYCSLRRRSCVFRTLVLVLFCIV
ncbi:hypothetical protein RRG08_031537 [Elysia crispata]|uniref:Uncharacterized protein n=1 Tax=Elysia crispata TaxID=231223 RepID=A0AAE0Z3Y1_9GAST|nr:hypothetical protein RRG08_031537 [Elysia crispata]